MLPISNTTVLFFCNDLEQILKEQKMQQFLKSILLKNTLIRQELKKEIAEHKEQIKKDQEFLDAIQSDTEALEKFAREEYKMKGENEDVYIIKED